ncbi:tail fiber protein [Mycobacterium phage Phaedrus]|uniref:tail fiber protein n=1 Tax=Mycobacterium phage Phaedrus TaxID=546184 RepID=UPI00017992BB|nr:tail fiber protein [Mycobacterium phage Phaedrus]ACF34003.1 hypothetical protein PHAEDRUS_39 [Mycobacterium phage Phaedrus]
MAYFAMYDPAKPPGQRLAPEVRAEIAIVAPSGLNDGAVTTIKLDEGAVTEPKLGYGSVTSTKIAAGGVELVNMAQESVDTAQLVDDSVTDEKAGPGVMQCHDDAGNPVTFDFVPMTAESYAALTTKAPNTLYGLTT